MGGHDQPPAPPPGQPRQQWASPAKRFPAIDAEQMLIVSGPQQCCCRNDNVRPRPQPQVADGPAPSSSLGQQLPKQRRLATSVWATEDPPAAKLIEPIEQACW